MDGLVTWELIWFDIDLNADDVAWENKVEGLFGVAGKRLGAPWWCADGWFGKLCWATPPLPWLTWFPIILLGSGFILLRKLLVPLTIVSSMDLVFEPRMEGKPLVNRFSRFGWLNEFDWELEAPWALKRE